MDKNYYDILQVNKNASPEIIEKAYKTLAKKYHPDLQDNSNKKQAEEILKEINEAYETLSDPEKKRLYDEKLLSYERLEAEKIMQNEDSKKEKYITNDFLENNNEQELLYQQKLQQNLKQERLLKEKQQIIYEQQLEQARQKAYHDAYIQDLKNRGYKIKYKKSIKDYIKLFVCILIVLSICFILWQIPFIHNYFIDLYNNNPLLKAIIDPIIHLF